MVKVKICGLSRAQDIAAVNRILPDYVGFVFAESRRKISVEKAAEFKEKLDPDVAAVGVFVDEEIEIIADIFKKGIIDIVQLHGGESDDYIKRLKENCGCPVIKAVRVDSILPDLPLEADYLLFDSIVAGSGQRLNWSLITGIEKPFFLAGGLSAGNVKIAIEKTKPFAVDVSSGVETNGVKDSGKIRNFTNFARKA